MKFNEILSITVFNPFVTPQNAKINIKFHTKGPNFNEL